MLNRYDFILPGEQRPAGIGENLYILGTSEDGPIMQPMRINDPQHAARVFGDRLKGTLVRAFEQAYDINSNIPIYLMRITGKSAKLKIAGFVDGEYVDLINLRMIYGGSKYNDVVVRVEHRETTGETVLAFDFGDYNVSYALNEHMDIDHLIKHINEDARANIHHIFATTEYGHLPTEIVTASYTDSWQFTGGEDGVDATRDELYIACDEALTLLLGRPIDVIVLAGMYVDDVHPVAFYGQAVYGNAMYASNEDFLQLVDTMDNNRFVSYHERLIDFCRDQMKLGYMSHGVIGLRPLKTVPDTIEHDDSYIVRLVQATIFRDRYGLMEFRNGQWSDKGHYISVAGFEPIFRQGTPQEYYDNGAVAYAALLAGHYDTTTNVKIPIQALRYELSEDTMGQLATLGVVTVRNSVRNGYVVTSGVTAAHWESELHDVANMRMSQLTIANMNDIVQTIYESDIAPEVRRLFTEKLVKERLEELARLGVLVNYDYRILFDPKNDYGTIALTLQTKYTVEGISTSAEIGYAEV
jgi:hypothetical protein